MPFQLNAKQLSITYPQCSADKNEILRFLQQTFPRALYIAVSKEAHLDGRPHLHCGVSLDAPHRTRDSRFLDYQTFHPNIQGTRNFGKWVDYLKKDGDWVEHGTPPVEKTKRVAVDEEELIEAAKTMQEGEFLAYCSVNRLLYAKALWDAYHTDTVMTLTSDMDFEGNIDPRFESLVSTAEFHDNLSLLIVGEAGIGKTTWAKRTIPKPCLFVTHIDDLRKFKVGFHVSILFDDVSFTHFPDTAQIHLVDYENPRSVHVRYGTARIPAGVRKIFTCNTFPVSISIPAVLRRTQVLLCHQDDLGRFT